MTTTTHARPAPQVGPSPATDVRQLVSFSFYRVDPEWRRLPKDVKAKHAVELQDVITAFGRKMLLLTYSLVGMRSDVDFMVWAVGKTPEELQELSAAIRQTALGGYLTTPHLFLSMTKRSTYVDKLDPDHPEKRRFITPAHAKYFFVYPFVKTREWYLLPLEERQAMMDEHIIVGSKFVSVRLHTTYSFGLDDQDFVVAFETDEPKDFLDLVMQLRETKASKYTVRDTPIFTCVLKPIQKVLQDIGGPK